MEKQTKVINKIKGSLVHGNEGQLGTKKNDECYTSMTDILKELSYWANLKKFQGKNIICPCDWDIVDENGNTGVLTIGDKTYYNVYGITIVYDTDKFAVSSNNVFKCVKTVTFMGEEFDVSSSADVPAESVEIELTDEAQIEDLLRNKLTCNFIRTLTQHARAWGIKSITASGYNPANNKGTPFQEVDYSKYDVCITNPPFSLYKEFMGCMIDSKIDFVILAPLLNRQVANTARPLVLKQCYLGHGIELHMNFSNPTSTNKYHTKVVNCDWLTSYPEAQAERNALHYKSGVKYETYKDDFEEMKSMTCKDGTHPIRVSMSTYPDDYDGWMFATIGVLDNLDQEGYEWIITSLFKLANTDRPDLNPLAHNFNNDMYDGGFHGVLFRKKQNKETK